MQVYKKEGNTHTNVNRRTQKHTTVKGRTKQVYRYKQKKESE